MEITKLLEKTHSCNCGMEHSCDIKHCIIEKDAVLKLPQIAKDYKGILLVADRNTYKVCGKRVEEILPHKDIFVYEEEGLVIPNEIAWEKLQKRVTSEIDLIVGIGSGVIQDLCKYVSFLCKIDYFIVATAPSMDGYSSSGAAMIANDMKITFSAHVPKAIVADTEVLKNAPMDMIVAGFGDIIGKYSCINDWELSALVNGEYYCPWVAGLVLNVVNDVRALSDKLIQRDETAAKKLMEALVISGICMSFVGNSRPASGSEHHFSHFFEITGILENKPYFSHGVDVAYSTVESQKMREEILNMKNLPEKFEFDREKWADKIRGIYGKAAEGVIAQQDKLGWYQKDYLSIYKEKFDDIKEILKKVPSSAELVSIFEGVGLDMKAFFEMYGEEKLQNARFYAKDLKDRYTVLWMHNILFADK